MDSADFSQFVVTMADEAACDTYTYKLQDYNLIQNKSIIFGREKGHPLIGCPHAVSQQRTPALPVHPCDKPVNQVRRVRI